MSFELQQFIMSVLGQNNIIERLTKIEETMKQIESWRDQTANPNMLNNFNNIQTIFTDIQNNIVPAINKAKQDAINASQTAINALDEVTAASNIAIEAKNTAEGFLAIIEKARMDAENALVQAQAAFDEAKVLFDRFELVSSGVTQDIDAVQFAGSTLITTLVTELSGIGEQIRLFGEAILLSAKGVGKEALELGEEYVEWATEIWVPMEKVIGYAKKLPEISEGLDADNIDDIVDLPKNLYRMAKFLVWSTNPKSVLGEFREGLNQTQAEIEDLGESLEDFGETFVKEGTKVTKRINIAGQTIDGAFKLFINAFFKIFDNLGKTLQGQPVIR